MRNTLQKNRWGLFGSLYSFSLMFLITMMVLGTRTVSAQGSSLSMNGNSYIEVSDAPALRLTSSMTIEAWIYLDDNANNTIIDKGNYNFLFETHPNGQPALGLYSRSWGQWIYSGGSLPINQWAHVAVSFKTGPNGVNFYLNGNLLSTHTALGPLASDTGPMNIARQDPLGCKCNMMNGDIDELRIWNVARTQSEIADNMNHNTMCSSTGLVAYFPFDENGGNTVSSSVGGYTGTIVNVGGTAWVPGVATSPAACTLQTLTILGGSGVQGQIDPYTEASRDGGLTWQPAYLTGWHPWGFAAGTNSWVNFDPSPFVGLNSTTDYRIRFNVPADYSEPRMTFVIKADNRAWLSINGVFISQFDGESSGAAGDQVIAQALQPGLNEITIRLQDFGGWVGLNYRIDMTMFSNEEPTLQPSTFSNTAPAANAGVDQTINCASTAGSKVTLNGSGTDADNDQLTYSWTTESTVVSTAASFETGILAPGTHTFTLTVNDGNGGTSSDNVIVTINSDATAPVPDVAELPTVTGECSATVTAPTATDACSGAVTGTTTDPLTYSSQGTFTITWTFSDANGNSVQQTQTVVVKDITPPVITAAINLLTLWPPNHKYETVKLSDFGLSVYDNCAAVASPAYVITKVTSDEVEDSKGNGDGNTLNDIVIANHFKSVDLRKEREGTGNGRVYTIYVAVSDGRGNVGNKSLQVQVPHDKNDTAVDDGAAYEIPGGTVISPSSSVADDSKNESLQIAQKMESSVVNAGQNIPEGFELNQNYPNPFNPTTTISIALPEAGYYTLKVYNSLGQQVAELVNGNLARGNYNFKFDASKLTTGLYIYTFRGNNVNISRKMVLMK
ncbi:MAG: hypothetical protein CVV24_06005 [Ignavibacteriae bacterium HGW-Ignavibacteriae-3]|nr:MAG: hypothetical protein CVV24_06005 [Ignavibacteriae bacterium HGW-Ignavibacteriae-3]